jgi:hypothetical protein
MMNERIKELAVQAKFMAEEDINRQISYNTELKAFAEKFAKLIVRECAQFVEDKFDFIGDEIIVKEKMLAHFGVEND